MAQEGQNKAQKVKSTTTEREEAVLRFWQEKDIFTKSLKKLSPKSEFVFYDGPPFATGLPHYGSLLSSIVKDVIPRYKTMRGYRVRRRWGWDCHGLPIENMIEKELGLKAKKEIDELGIDVFNETCRSSVLRYSDAWKEYIDRIGRWVEYDNAYKTMDNTFMESVWWALKSMHNKKLLYEGRKVLLYCPHCETPLARAEIQQDNSYKDITEEAVTVKLKVREPKEHGLPENTYILAWTTTPWTLPGNIALAVGPKIKYVLVQDEDEHYIIARDLAEENVIIKKNIIGDVLLGIDYEPLYGIDKVIKSDKRSWYVTDADFVTTEEGTGIVHTAVIYGEDDYELGKRKDLAMIPLLDASGHFNSDAPDFIEGTYFKAAEKKILNDLEKRGLIFERSSHTHSYPHCHRCDTPLIYNAITSWFIDIQKVKARLVRLNEKINWFPGHLKNGRFLNILKDAPDWTISRNRYWASPLPIWRCNECDKGEVFGSVKELTEHTKTRGNKFFVMRHGKAVSNQSHQVNYRSDVNDPITKNGVDRVEQTCSRMRKKDFDIIVTSPVQRTKQTAEIVADHIGLDKKNFIIDERIQELQVGKYQGHSWDAYHKDLSPMQQFTKPIEGGETRRDTKTRAGNLLYELEKKHKDKKILFVTHEGVYEALLAVVEGADLERSVELAGGSSLDYAELKHLPFKVLPHNKYYELDLHRPYIDEIELTCSCGGLMRRIPEVVDGWVESGSMPFAEYHYPFENKRVFKKRSPGDFVVEYVAQTRTWFYYMHAISGILFDQQSFKNVVTTGNILAKDGSKMSKSKGNYTDPLQNLDIYGADALRYYLMGSTVMQGEDVRFLDGELRESHNRVVNILANVLSFYKLYAEEKPPKGHMNGTNLLDSWIRVRLAQLISEVTNYLESYDTVRTARVVREFTEDLSTWYIRRSRDRFKSIDEHDRQQAMATTRFVLLETSRVIAPLMPFIAENIYQSAKGKEESVHLDKWPSSRKLKKEDESLLTNMSAVREAVSHGLEARARASIKVRQPLPSLTISVDIPQEYLYLIQDEVNVKKIIIDTEMIERVQLDTDISDELLEEGNLRDFVRHVQGLRKDMNLEPNQEVTLVIGTDDIGREFVEKFIEDIKDATSLKEILLDTGGEGLGIKIGDKHFSLSLEK